MRRILFICWANCVRSQMAEALFNYRGAGRVDAVSGGIVPAGFVHAMALRALDEMRVRARGLRSKPWTELRHEPLDAVVTLCPVAHEAIESAWPAEDCHGIRPPLVHWGLDDPTLAETPGRVMTETERLDAFREARNDLRECADLLALAPGAAFESPEAFVELLRGIGRNDGP